MEAITKSIEGSFSGAKDGIVIAYHGSRAVSETAGKQHFSLLGPATDERAYFQKHWDELRRRF